MGIRLIILYLFVAFLVIYAWRNWFVSLCGLMLLTATIGHSDMPRSIAGIPGLNVWNVVFLNLVAAWLSARQKEGYPWDMPGWAKAIFIIYVVIRFVAFLRCAVDQENWQGSLRTWSLMDFTNDYLLNSFKYLVPPIMFYDACRSRHRQIIGLIFILLIPFYYSAVTVRNIPLSGLQSYGKQEELVRRRIAKRIGFHSNSVALCCVTGFWAILGLSSLRRRGWHVALVIAACAIIALATALCRSRAGYIALVGVGVLFAVFVYRSLLIGLPVFVGVAAALFPGVVMRLTLGTNIETASGETVHDMTAVTAGRSDMWPVVIDYCWTSPVFGHGLKMMERNPLRQLIVAVMGDGLGHPHNAYLEAWLDTGILGLVTVLVLYGIALGMGIQMALDRRDKLYRTFGGALIAGVGALMMMGFSGQSFLPKENNQLLWCLMGLGLRVWVDRSRGGAFGHPHEDEDEMMGEFSMSPQPHHAFAPLDHDQSW